MNNKATLSPVPLDVNLKIFIFIRISRTMKNNSLMIRSVVKVNKANKKLIKNEKFNRKYKKNYQIYCRLIFNLIKINEKIIY